MASPTKKKTRVREENQLIDDAAAQNAAPVPEAVPAPQPVPTQAQANPALVPPQPGMIPTGWMFPAESAQSVAMDTGDVNLAAAAPGGGVVGGAPITNEEAQLVTEYRKWSKAKKIKELKARLADRVRESDDEGEEPEVENELGGESAGLETSEELPEDGVDVLDELKDIAIDINALFDELGGDVDETLPGNPDAAAQEEAEDEGIEEADLNGDGEVTADEQAESEMMEARKEKLRAKLRERAKARAAKPKSLKELAKKQARVKESELARAVDIKFPAGTPPISEQPVDADAKMKAYEAKVQARRNFLKELRAREASALEADYSDANPDNTIEDSVGDTIDEVMPNQRAIESRRARSAVVREAAKPRSEQFVENYNAKKQLNFKQLLEQGLLG